VDVRWEIETERQRELSSALSSSHESNPRLGGTCQPPDNVSSLYSACQHRVCRLSPTPFPLLLLPEARHQECSTGSGPPLSSAECRAPLCISRRDLAPGLSNIKVSERRRGATRIKRDRPAGLPQSSGGQHRCSTKCPATEPAAGEKSPAVPVHPRNSFSVVWSIGAVDLLTFMSI
jgi:hypothetical protein